MCDGNFLMSRGVVRGDGTAEARTPPFHGYAVGGGANRRFLHRNKPAWVTAPEPLLWSGCEGGGGGNITLTG